MEDIDLEKSGGGKKFWVTVVFFFSGGREGTFENHCFGGRGFNDLRHGLRNLSCYSHERDGLWISGPRGIKVPCEGHLLLWEIKQTLVS